MAVGAARGSTMPVAAAPLLPALMSSVSSLAIRFCADEDASLTLWSVAPSCKQKRSASFV
jgi:hypothetical protein